MRGLVICEKHVDSLRQQKTTESLFIFQLTPAMRETSAKLAKHDERQNDSFRLFEQRDGLNDTLTEIDVSIGVERYLHRQRPSST